MKPGDAQTANGILFTDEYQLTMAQLYFRAGLHEQRVRFEHFFRHYPDYGTHKAGYCISAGLEWIVDWMQQSRFRDEDIAYLGGQRGRTGAPCSTPTSWPGYANRARLTGSPYRPSRRVGWSIRRCR